MQFLSTHPLGISDITREEVRHLLCNLESNFMKHYQLQSKNLMLILSPRFWGQRKEMHISTGPLALYGNLTRFFSLSCSSTSTETILNLFHFSWALDFSNTLLPLNFQQLLLILLESSAVDLNKQFFTQFLHLQQSKKHKSSKSMFLKNITDHFTSLLKKFQQLPLLNRQSSWHSSHLQHQLTILSLLSDIHCFHQQCFPTSEKLHAIVFGIVIPLSFMSSSTEIPLTLQDLFSLQNFT